MLDPARDFFMSEGPLKAGNASVALLVLEDSRYLMQLRDQKPGIFYPGHWGLFGGKIDPGETAESGLRRELAEELDFEARDITYFTRFAMDFTALGSGPVDRIYFEVKVSASELGLMKLGEGADMQAFDGHELLANFRVTPYDAFAIWMHLTQKVHLSGLAPQS